ncbi:MAG: nicotinamide-nucleotide amidohydrolase family protein [Chloroflexota bacterium]|nr:nicotinamide-nucleotide amidohydrolase family protein [Chloroflexota bacterium]MDE3193685.1 nicotinamide-nucleotide amidohydrolase family protein [Chloroflexota bacterium]
MPPKSAPSYDDLVARMKALQPRLKRRKLTVASAESCSGGLLGAVLSELSGSSDHYQGGAVVYSNAAKTELADVPADLIHSHGAVSPVVAAALARGARERLGAAIGLGITGIAGPTGATPGKPIGLVYVAVDSEKHSSVRTCRFAFDRAGNRRASVATALDLLEQAIG